MMRGPLTRAGMMPGDMIKVIPPLTKRVVQTDAGPQWHLGIRPQFGGGGLVVDEVAALPAVPTIGYQKVFWYSNSYRTGGTATTSQLWEAYAGQTTWTACQFLTADSGVPV